LSKVIVITGAGVGLGRALARRFAADGEQLVLLGRTAAKVEKVAAEIGARALALGCDVASPDSVRAAFAAIGKRHASIDVLINNAAIYEPFTIAEARDDQILNSLTTNVAGPIFCSRQAIPLMRRGGHIINVCSESVDVMFPLLSLYQTSKAALEKFSEALYRELEPQGIAVSVVRGGSMMDADKTWDIDPAVKMKFAQACMAAGIDLRTRPLSQFASVTTVFRTLIDLPADVQADFISLHARATKS
jgi:meso-butanediol dehydrogenase / (S,S)-butanediol dehydrogenase / diacetyl reductase